MTRKATQTGQPLPEEVSQGGSPPDDGARAYSSRQGRLQDMLDSIRHGIMVIGRGGVVAICNRRAMTFLELPEDLCGKPFDLRSIIPRLGDAPLTFDESGDGITFTRSDGQIIEIHADPLPDGGRVLVIEDVTADRKREESLKQAQSEYFSLFDNAVCGIYRDTVDGTPIRANRALITFNGYDSEPEYQAAVKKNGGNWYVDPDRPKHFMHLMETRGEVRDLVSEVYSHRNRKRYWITENAWYVRDAMGKPIYIEGTIQDATERMQGLASIEKRANTDPLTGAASRFHFMNTLNTITRSTSGACALLTIDLDKFKEVNDQLGHGAGDAVLKTTAQRLQAVAPPPALVARLGGDEFAIILPGQSATMKAEMVAAEVVRTMRAPMTIEGYTTTVGASVGVALFPVHAGNSNELLNNADAALYHVKSGGKGRARMFDADLKRRIEQRKALEAELRDAVSTDSLELFFQPVIYSKSQMTRGFEALMRWNHPRRGLLTPNEFIGIAEDAGLMTELGNWAIRNACQRASLLPPDLVVGVNVSPSQFRAPGLVEVVKDALATSQLAARRLVLEITESTLLANEGMAARIMDGLSGLGVRLALDDFGTGYSSLSYLQRYAFATVKIDRSFVAGIGHKPANLAIIRAVVKLASELRMHVVAEGVETEEQAAILRSEGCTYLQGFLFGRPRPFVDVCADLAAGRLRSKIPMPARTDQPDEPVKRTVHKGL